MLAAVFGAIFGSFLNVVAYRLPRGESLSRPRSRCPQCQTPIKPYDNVPVLSWLALRGRCRTCRAPISARYHLVPITLIDLDHRIIPNRLTLIGAVAAPAILALTEPDALPEHLIAAAAAGGFFLVALLAYPRGMGMGDVKLAAMLGLFLGSAVVPAIFVALVSGTLVGAAVIARKGAREGRKTAVPFGPFLALGAVVALFWGDAMVDWYLQTFL